MICGDFLTKPIFEVYWACLTYKEIEEFDWQCNDEVDIRSDTFSFPRAVIVN